MFRPAAVTFALTGCDPQTVTLRVFGHPASGAVFALGAVITAVDLHLGCGGDEFRIINWSFID